MECVAELIHLTLSLCFLSLAFFDFPYDANVFLGLAVILVPSALNAFKWYKRSLDPTFEGWF